MRIEKDYESNEEIITSQDAMSACMDQISEILIEPMLSMDMINKEQQEVLFKWMNEDDHLFRSAVMSLVTLLGMGYTTHPAVAPRISAFHRCGYG